jgi:cytochrome P450
MSASDPLPRLPFEQPPGVGVAPLMRKLQAEHAITRVLTPAGDEAWLVTRYAEVRRLLADGRLGLSHRDPEHAARISDSALFGGAIGNFDTEEAEHSQMRSLLQPFFAPKRMRDFRPRVERVVESVLDLLAAKTPPVDLHAALSLPVPVLVICELLGVPYDDREQFREWTGNLSETGDRELSGAALASLVAYAQTLVERKRRDPGDDVISALCVKSDPSLEDGHIAYLAALLLFAGYETTVARLDLGALLLFTHPDQRRTLLDDEDLLPKTIEEILRTGVSGGDWVPRYARSDITVEDVTIRAGELVLLAHGAADHDDRVFPNPERFDIARAPNPHLAFGYGMRYCLGAPLARIELHAVFSRLFQRFPDLRLAVPIDQVKIRADLLTGGVTDLPVTW